jgi:polysaccharide biosynthesis protein PslH
MKILFVTPFLRVPPDNGLAIRSYQILKHLTQRNEVVVASFETPQQPSVSKWIAASTGEFFSLGQIETGPRSSRFPRLGRILSYPPSSFGRVSAARLALQLRQALKRHPDIAIVVLDTHLSAQAMLKLNGLAVPSVAVFHDILAKCAQREFELCGWRPYKLIYFAEWLQTIVYERQISRRFKNIVAMSEPDACSIKRYNSNAEVFVSPNGADTKSIFPNRHNANGNGSAEILMLANFGYPPNVDAFEYFYRDIMPSIWQKKPQARLTVAGRFPTTEMLKLVENEERLQVTGPVDDVRDWYARADVAVVPLRIGSGVKLKVLEAFAAGVPVVTTSVGIEGIDAQPGRDIRLADVPDDFARNVLELLESSEQRHALASNARLLVEKKYDWEKVGTEFERYLQNISVMN